jgi:hypothetical protein
MPAISDGSPCSARWSDGLNQFQHFEPFAATDWAGYSTRQGSFSANSFMRVPAAKSSGLCVHPCSMTTRGNGCPR